MTRNLAVIGLDEFNRKYLMDVLRDAGDISFHAGLDRDDTTIHGPGFDFESKLGQARRNIEEIEGGVDGVLTYWDFPSTSLAPLLARDFGLPYASPEAVLRCEHKLWSRLEQAEVIETPAFCGFSPLLDDPLADVSLDFPFWMKPVVGHSSMLGFEVRDEKDFDTGLEEICKHIRELTRPFRYFCDVGGLPEELAAQGTTLCIAEEIISDGDQYTLEGYVQNGAMTIHGVIESHRTSNEHTFSRYQYPSGLDMEIAARMEDMCRRTLAQYGYDNCPFNVEFFYNPETDRVRLLEVNPRISQSHSDLFLKVDGQPNQQIPVDLALGPNQKLGIAWPTTATVRARRSIRLLGRIAAITPSGMDRTSAKVMAQAPRNMVTGRRSKMTPATSALR